MRFVFRQERRLQVAYAFPSASEQVALHALDGGSPLTAGRHRRPTGAYMVRSVYWPLIGGFIAFVLIAIVLGRIMDPDRRR